MSPTSLGRRRRRAVALLALCVSSGCLLEDSGTGPQDDAGEIEVPPPAIERAAVIGVAPDSAQAGDLVTITLRLPHPDIFISSYIWVNGWLHNSEMQTANTISFRMPLLRQIDSVQLDLSDSRSQQTYSLDVAVTHSPEPYGPGVSVTWFKDPAIDVNAFERYSYRRWRAELAGDTVKMIDSLHAWLNILDVRLDLLSQGSGNLPMFLAYTVRSLGRADTLQTGLVKIAEWEPGQVISGAVFGGEEDGHLRRQMHYFRCTW